MTVPQAPRMQAQAVAAFAPPLYFFLFSAFHGFWKALPSNRSYPPHPDLLPYGEKTRVRGEGMITFPASQAPPAKAAPGPVG